MVVVGIRIEPMFIGRHMYGQREPARWRRSSDLTSALREFHTILRLGVRVDFAVYTFCAVFCSSGIVFKLELLNMCCFSGLHWLGPTPHEKHWL